MTTQRRKTCPAGIACGAALTVLTLMVSTAAAQVVTSDDPALKGIDVVEHPGDTVPLDVVLVNDVGDTVTLGRYFDGTRPVLLIMGYYSCPMLCNLVLNGITNAARELPLAPDKDYRLLMVSINPAETFTLAADKKQNYLTNLGIPAAAEGWTFFVAGEAQSKKLADAVGFKYFYVEERKEYAHPAVVIVLSPTGVISRYLYGIEYKMRDLRLALLEASEGEIGGTFDRILLFCYHYDPKAGAYTLFAANLMKLGGAATLVFLAALLGFFWMRERRARASRVRDSLHQGTTR